jgi:excisionase family DNA binding protein
MVNDAAVILENGDPRMLDHLLSPDEVAEYLGVPIATLYAWRGRHTGPRAVRVGRHLRYRENDLAAWIESQATGGRRAS